MRDEGTKGKVKLFMQDSTLLEGMLEFFEGSRLTDILNAKYDKEQYVKLCDAKVSLVDGKEICVPWVLVNRHKISKYTELMEE